jgi:hypothetical protein
VQIYSAQKGEPSKVFIVGASEAGIITALSVEQHPDVYSAGLAACGPIGNFPLQIDYFGDARATFEYFFPGLIPGPPFDPNPGLVSIWSDYYDKVVQPIVFAPAFSDRLNQWVKVAHLPYDADDYLNTVQVSVRDVLRYSVVNLKDASATLGGFPFDNSKRWYAGSSNDLLLNLTVPRATASPAAIAAMTSPAYATSGVLQRPLITLHTMRDQQVPFWHEKLYALKTLASGAFLARHVPIAIDRFEHCNFTPDEVLASFALMLFYDGAVQSISGVGSVLTPTQVEAFGARVTAAGMPYTAAGSKLTLKLRDQR